jgi:hypothetical protein
MGELAWHVMHMASYSQAVRGLQPIIDPVFAAIQYGLDVTNEDHARRDLSRRDEPWFYLHSVRRVACQRLREQGLQATEEDGRFRYPMSALIVLYNGFVVRIRHSDAGPDQQPEIPGPGRSRSGQRFWRQAPFDGMKTDNLLLIWRDNHGTLVDPMTLVRPLGGNHRKESLQVNWSGRLSRNMTDLRADDLDELVPDVEYRALGEVD